MQHLTTLHTKGIGFYVLQMWHEPQSPPVHPFSPNLSNPLTTESPVFTRLQLPVTTVTYPPLVSPAFGHQ